MRQANNLIQDDAKTLVSERFFDNEAVRTAQPVIALRDAQTTNHVSEVVVQTPRGALRPMRKSGNSLVYILLSIFALGATAAAFYFLPVRNQSSASEVSQDAVQDNIDDSVKPKILVSQKPIEPQQPKTSSSAATEKNKTAKQNERAAREVPPLTPDETEPGQWMNEDVADVEDEDAPKPKTKKSEKKANKDLETFVREVENAERRTRRIKKVLDDFEND